jgi:HPt (histidine-containing phosphotransfer) domain-containing protein
VLDLGVLHTLVGGDPSVVQALLAEFIPAAGRVTDELRAAAARDDDEGVAQAAHKLKSAARSVGALALADLAEALEHAGRAGDKARIGHGMTLLEPAWAEARSAVGGVTEAQDTGVATA